MTALLLISRQAMKIEQHSPFVYFARDLQKVLSEEENQASAMVWEWVWFKNFQNFFKVYQTKIARGRCSVKGVILQIYQ